MKNAHEPELIERALGIGLAVARAAIGAAIWLAPERALPALGFDRAPRQGEALSLARIAATRDIVLGVWQAGSLGDRMRLQRATLAVTVSDAGDALAFAMLARRGGQPGLAAKGLSAAIPATLVGAWLAARLNRKRVIHAGSRNA